MEAQFNSKTLNEVTCARSRKDLLNTLEMYETEILERKKTKSTLLSDNFRSYALVSQHPSVKKILETNKRIIIPKKVYNCDLAPVITLDKNEVSNWYAQRFEYLRQMLQSTVTNKNGIVNNINKHKKTLKRRNGVLYSEDEDEDEDSYKSRRKIPKRVIPIYSESESTDSDSEVIITQQNTSTPKHTSQIISSDMCGLNDKSSVGNYKSNDAVPNSQACNSFIKEKLLSTFSQHTKITNQSENVSQNNVLPFLRQNEQIKTRFNISFQNGEAYKQIRLRDNTQLNLRVVLPVDMQSSNVDRTINACTNTEKDEKVVQYLCNKYYRQLSTEDDDFQSEVLQVENNEIRLNDLFIMMKKYVIPVKFRCMPTISAQIVANTNNE